MMLLPNKFYYSI
jgi:hypothetical protein